MFRYEKSKQIRECRAYTNFFAFSALPEPKYRVERIDFLLYAHWWAKKALKSDYSFTRGAAGSNFFVYALRGRQGDSVRRNSKAHSGGLNHVQEAYAKNFRGLWEAYAGANLKDWRKDVYRNY